MPNLLIITSCMYRRRPPDRTTNRPNQRLKNQQDKKPRLVGYDRLRDTRKPLVSHHLRGLGGAGSRLVIVDLHSVVGSLGSLALALALLVLELVLALVLEVHAALVLGLLLGVGGLAALLDAAHLGIAIHVGGGAALAVRGGGLDTVFLGLLLGLVGAVLLAVGLEVGLGLLGREFSGGGSLRVPGKRKSV